MEKIPVLFTLQYANHGTMSISYDVTSCAKLKCIVSCFNFGFEDNFIDRKCLTIDMEQAVKNLIRHVFFSINHLSQHLMVFCLGSKPPHAYIRINVT